MTPSSSSNPKKGWFILIATFLVGGVVGYGIVFLLHGHPESIGGVKRESSGQYAFINPLLECDVASGAIDSVKINFKPKLERYIDSIKDKHGLEEYALLFRDLNNGPTFGINEEKEFIPASLMKVPVMIAYYKWADSDPTVLNRGILFEEGDVLNIDGYQLIAPNTEDLVVGKTYKVEDLIERIIIYSDNQAVALLLKDLPQGRINEIFSLLGLEQDVLTEERAELSVKEYAAFFRILFNSSYLSRTNSEKALELLSRSVFKDGLVAGVPRNIVVSHKFGESGVIGDLHQLHDCGVIYYPQHPYLLCVMTRGEKTTELESVIANISQFVFEEIASQYAK